MLRGLRREDLFTVVLEQFQTDTADYADILLPATTFLEHTDLYFAYGHYHLQLARPALPRSGRGPVATWRSSARWPRRMGFDDACFRDSEDDMIRTLLDSDHPFLKGITLERLDREHSVRLNVAENGDAVPAVRRRRLRHAASASANSAPRILDYTPPVESRFGDADLRAQVSAGADLVQERRQHELHLRQSSRRGPARLPSCT